MTNPYLRAAQKFPALRQQAQERLSKRPGERPEPKPKPKLKDKDDSTEKGKRGAVQ